MEAKASNKEIIDDEISSITKQSFISCGWIIATVILISLLVNACIRIDITYLDPSITEVTVTETVQVILLIITFLVFLSIANTKTKIHHAAILVAGFFCAITIRELDYWFDMIYHGFWLYPALSVSFIAIIKAAKAGRQTVNEIALLIETPYFKQMIASVTLLLFFSRLYGTGSLWRQIMGDHYLDDVKNISEESIELLCYSLICISAIKVYRHLKK